MKSKHVEAPSYLASASRITFNFEKRPTSTAPSASYVIVHYHSDGSSLFEIVLLMAIHDACNHTLYAEVAMLPVVS